MSTVPENIVGDGVTTKRWGDGTYLAIQRDNPTPPVQQLSGLTGDRLLAVQALQLLSRLNRDLREARAQWNQDWFRRVMHARSKAVLRVRRRWEKLNPRPIPLGSLRRRYHANLSRYLNTSPE